MKTAVLIIVFQLLFCLNTSCQILADKDTLIYNEVFTDIPLRMGCYIEGKRNEEKNTISFHASCDTAKGVLMIYLDKHKRIVWHKEPFDSTLYFLKWVHSVPLQGYRLQKMGNYVYYRIKKKKKPLIQYSLKKNDTIVAHPYYLYRGRDTPHSYVFTMSYEKDTMIQYHNKLIPTMLYVGTEYRPDACETFLRIYRFCIDNNYFVPIFIVKDEFFAECGPNVNYEELLHINRDFRIDFIKHSELLLE